ncbi:MAG: aldehyde dehydrogenase, partial [Acidobacteria bacterium]|nr:aldehyde dehydrogenase [Acidobacteriota bacterium]
MIRVPVLRWGKPYESLETTTVSHFLTGEPIAEVDQATAGIVKRDLRRAGRARAALREIPIRELLDRMKEAARLYMESELPLGNGVQTPEKFVHAQSATTGLPEAMCRANMEKNRFVLERMDQVLDALTRGLELEVLSAGHGIEER